MEFLKSVVDWFFDNIYNVPVLIRAVGPYGLMAVVFAETGLLIGFFLPGDSLLITAGLFAAKGDLDIRFLVPSLILSAVVGGVLTPGPDVLSQVLMAGPLFGLYNISILIVWFIERAARERLEKLAKETGADLVPFDDKKS